MVCSKMTKKKRINFSLIAEVSRVLHPWRFKMGRLPFYTFEELKWHACHFILAKCYPFTDFIRTECADLNLQWCKLSRCWPISLQSDAFGVPIEIFIGLKWHACHFILAKCYPFADFIRTFCADLNLQWCQEQTSPNNCTCRIQPAPDYNIHKRICCTGK